MTKNLIVFTIDDKYVAPFCVAITSFAECNDVSNYMIGMVYSDISKNNLFKIRKFCKKLGLELLEKKIVDQFLDITVGYHFNSVIFYRLLLPDLFPDYQTLLYIDSDMLFLAKIDSLFELPILERDAVVAAIPKTRVSGIPDHLKKEVSSYFASGLLLINTKEFKKQKILEKAVDFLKNNFYDMPDQDALNSVVDSWIELDPKYGVETSFLQKKNRDGYEYLRPVLENPVIIQFSGRSKPWNYKNDHPYKDKYWEYLNKTPYARKYPSDMPTKIMLKEIFLNYFKKD